MKEKREKRLAREEKKKSKSRLTDVTQNSIKEKWSKRKPLNLDRIMDGLREVDCYIHLLTLFPQTYHVCITENIKWGSRAEHLVH